MSKHVLVTGTNGYLGNSLKKYITEYNTNMPPENQWHIVFLSVRGDEWKKESFADYDAVIHVAGIVHRKEQPEMENLYHEVNTTLTVELAKKYAKEREDEKKQAHFVFMSTMSVYGIVKGIIDENTETNPFNFYGKSKLNAEQILESLSIGNCREYPNLVVSVVRPPMIYGYECSGNYASLEKLAKKIPMFPKINNQRSMLYVENLCEFLRLLIDHKSEERYKVYCPQNREYVNTSELVAEIAKSYGKKVNLIPGFAGVIGLMANKIRVFAKVFGSLIYVKEMSVYPELGDYQIIDFKESVAKSSGNNTKSDLPEKDRMPTSKISVLMSVYYKEKPEYFKAAMESILAQTYPADEIVLMEDGPLTKELDTLIAEYERICNQGAEQDEEPGNKVYPKLVIHAFKENQQLGRALAKGVEICRNELIARMDTDDIAMPDRLYKQTLYMEQHPKVSVAGGAIREFNDEGTIDRIKQMPGTQEQIEQYIKLRNPLNHMTVMYRKSAILEAGNYQHFPFLEDYSLWSRMVSKGYQLRNMEDILVKARTSMGLVRRRSGWAYYKNFKKLRRMQHELGLTSTGEYLKAQVGTFCMIMTPGWFKEMAYKNVLRK